MSTSTVKVAKRGPYAGFRRVAAAIEAGQRFSNSGGSWRGGPSFGHLSLGLLPAEYRDSVHQADYVVYSYATPIAWRTDGEWVTPDARYSMTTSYHQSTTFTAVSQLRGV